MKTTVTKRSVAILLTVVLVATTLMMVACGTVSGTVIDPNKTQIYVCVYNGGSGTAWIENLANQWNAQNDKYQIIINGKEKFNAENAMAEIQSGISPTSNTVYYTVTPGFSSVIEQGYLEDLSDLIARDVDGNGVTIDEKIGYNDYFHDEWMRLESKSDGTGCYAVPYCCSYMGFVYDQQMFLDNNWLTYADVSVKAAAEADGILTNQQGNYLIVTNDTDYYNIGDKLLRAGKDGKYGTYDDGQPETETEWWDMIEQIVTVAGKKAFLWTGQHCEYMEPFFYALLAQIGGLTKDFATMMNRTSAGQSVQLNDGSSVVINYENGYLADRLQSITDSLKFLENIICTEDYVNAKAYSAQIPYSEIQNNFLTGFLNMGTNPETAMLAEGTWWENEARPFFTALQNQGYNDRGYGKRDYRYMLLPDFEGQANDKSCFCTVDVGAVIVAKLSDSEADKAKTAATKDFIAFTLTDENLRYFTKLTGVNRPYKYTLTAEDRANMTPFGRVSYDIMRDIDNIDIVVPVFQSSPFYKACGYYGMDWINTKRSTPYGNMVTCMRDTGSNGADGMIEALNNRRSPEEWAKMVQEARSMGLID